MQRIEKNKKAVSTVIETVLLILISVVAISIIAGVVLPWIRSGLESKKSCLEVMDSIAINTESGYTCVNNANNETRVAIEIKNAEVKKITVVLYKSEISDSYTLENNKADAKIRMFNQNYSQAIVLPPKDSMRTYVFNQISDRVKIIPVVGDTRCDIPDVVKLSEC